jgi:hypothetical protein
MVRVLSSLLQVLYDAPDTTIYWLVGAEWDCVINVFRCDKSPFATEFMEMLLPGGLRIIGLFFASDDVLVDVLDSARLLGVNPGSFIVRTKKVCKGFSVEGPVLTQREVAAVEVSPLLVVSSQTSIPIFSLDNPQIDTYLNSTVLFEIGGMPVHIGRDELNWGTLCRKGKLFVSAELFYKISSEAEQGPAPVLSILPNEHWYKLDIDWVSYFSPSLSVSVSLELHLQKLKDIVAYSVSNLRTQRNLQAVCYSFQNDYCPHPFCVVYFKDTDTEDSPLQLAQRQRVHELLRLPNDWPLVRSSCRINEPTESRLADVHLALLRPSTQDVGEKSAVKGKYYYYHYGQDGFDDKGWGCAYRSLQTIVSWFKEQHFTHKEVPSHFQIQKLLVEANDKPRDFIGSKEWIGAFEVMMVLDVYCSVTSRILNVASGAHLAERGRELSQHFQEHGSPVMIGGGVLAYTLLGVDYNCDTGEVRFLILDPHYTGSDTLKTILDKGWCSWKTVEIFRADCFYNLCLPQRVSYI